MKNLNNTFLWWVFLTFTFLTTLGQCLQCYKCFDTTKACFYGYTNSLGILNCSSSNEVCAVFQYETDDSSTVYTTTIRGCQPLIPEGICNQLMKTVPSKVNKNIVQRGVHCETCQVDLCNYSPIMKTYSPPLHLILLVTFLKYFMYN